MYAVHMQARHEEKKDYNETKVPLNNPYNPQSTQSDETNHLRLTDLTWRNSHSSLYMTCLVSNIGLEVISGLFYFGIYLYMKNLTVRLYGYTVTN